MASHDSSKANSGATLGFSPVSQQSKSAALAHFDAVKCIDQEHGSLLIRTGSARDHADMRTDQLASLLQLIRSEDGRGFRSMGDQRQLSVLWLASQLAEEVRAVLPVAVDEARAEVES